MIIDLRGNPGGWLDAAVAVADRFIQEGGIVSTRGKNGIENQNYTANRSGTWQVPLIVLIDHESASASEILAGAINDNRRGFAHWYNQLWQRQCSGPVPHEGSVERDSIDCI